MNKKIYRYVGDEESQSMGFYMDHGLAKLVKVPDDALGGFHADGTTFTWDENHGENPVKDDNHLYVRLYVAKTPTSHKIEYKFEAVLCVKDNDDFIAQIWKPLTLENWKELHKIYEDLCIPEMMTGKNLEELGFNF